MSRFMAIKSTVGYNLKQAMLDHQNLFETAEVGGESAREITVLETIFP